VGAVEAEAGEVGAVGGLVMGGQMVAATEAVEEGGRHRLRKRSKILQAVAPPAPRRGT
jgi:hypothetical protein